MIKNRIIALSFRFAAFIESFFAILAGCGLFNSKWDWANFFYYTIWTNIFAFLLFFYLAICTAVDLKKNGAAGYASYKVNIHMAVTLSITLTFVVFWAVLTPVNGPSPDILKFSNFGVHVITPLLVILDYFLFCRSGTLKLKDAFICILIPVVYFIFATILGFSGFLFPPDSAGVISNFPYFFMDYYKLGGWVILYIAVIAFIFFLAAYGMYILDKKWEKPVLNF